MKTRKILILIGIVLFTTGILSHVHSQESRNGTESANLNFNNTGGKPLSDKNFNIRLDLKKLRTLSQSVKKPGLKVYLLDTAIIYSVNDNPIRYIYTYSSGGDRLSILIQNLKNNIWSNSARETSVYDSYGNTLNTLWQDWQNGVWANLKRETNTYDINQRKNSSLLETWINNKWENAERETLAYDGFGSMVAYFSEVWSRFCINSIHEVYTYDASGNMLTAFVEKWVNGSWANERRYNYSYNAYGEMINSMLEEWISGNWTNSYRETYTYDGNHYLKTYVRETWAAISWVFSERYTYTYDSFGHVITGVGEIWSNSKWVNYEKGDFTYDASGDVQSFQVQLWAGNAWTNFSLTSYAYDGFGNETSGLYYSWDGQTWALSKDGVIELFYNSGNSIEYFTGYQIDANYSSKEIGLSELPDANVKRFFCSPNPVINSTIVTIELSKGLHGEIVFFDNKGRRLLTIFHGFLNAGEHDFPLLNLSFTNGVYYLGFQSSGNVKTVPIILSK
jgi:hypothetical protein